MNKCIYEMEATIDREIKKFFMIFSNNSISHNDILKSAMKRLKEIYIQSDIRDIRICDKNEMIGDALIIDNIVTTNLHNPLR